MRAPIVATDIRGDLVGLLPKLRRFALTLTGDVAEADELVQNVCQRAVAKIHLWNNEGRLDSWLYTMARQLWVEEARRHRVRTGSAKNAALQTSHVAIATIGPRDGHHAIASLSEGLASLFLLIDVEGHSYQQAADVLGIALSTIPSRLANARLQFAATGRNHPSKRL
jgi:RNA polymerase sigma-70 factor (ECF subfamily)